MQVMSTRTLIFKNPVTEARATVLKTPQGAAVKVPDWIKEDPYFELATSGDEPVLTVLPRGTKIAASKVIEAPVVEKGKKAPNPKTSSDGLGGPVAPFQL